MSGDGIGRRFRRLSLRGRLPAITVLPLVVALLGSNVLVIGLLRRDLVRQLDERIRTAATVTARWPYLPDVAGEKAPQARDTLEQQLIGDIHLTYLAQKTCTCCLLATEIVHPAAPSTASSQADRVPATTVPDPR